MKKRFLAILIILIFLILNYSFSNSIFADDLIHGVVPTKVTATMSGETSNGTFYFTYEFWNVGELGGSQYSAVTCTSYFSENDSTDVTSGTFTGGPNGDIYFQGSQGQIHLKLHDGVTITNAGGNSFSIDNPQAFKGWVDKEISIAPTIELEILEGPIILEGGKLRWTVKATATGEPAPTIEFFGDPSESITATGTENVINITIGTGIIFELTATAKNLMGTDTASMSFTNEQEVDAPTLELRVTDGPVALEGGKLSWTIKAIVTGKPTPTVEFHCEPWESMSSTDDYYTKNITALKGKIVELTATASNEIYGDKTVTMTFVNEDSGARFSDIAGQVEIRPDNDPEAWSSAKLQSMLYVDMHIRTLENSTAILSFTDGSTFILKPESEIVLSSASSKDSNFKILWGHMMLNIKKMMKDGSMIQEMQNAAASIKGTILVLSETGTESTIKVIEGTVEFKLLDSSKSVLVSKGESVVATKNGLSEVATFDPAEELKSWEAITGKTIETIGDGQTETIKETADTTIQKTSVQFPTIYIILIATGIILILIAVIVAVLIVKRTKK